MAARKKAPKVRRTKEWKRRSEASKKGWKARKLKEEILLRRRAKPAVKKVKPKAPRAVKVALKSRKREKRLPGLSVPVAERIAELEKENERLRYERTFVSAWKPEYVKRDGSPALYPSALRLYPDEAKRFIIRRMKRAEKRGHANEMAMELAREEGVSLREVWSLFMSP